MQVPAVGRVKKTYVIAGAAVVAGIVGYAWWRRGQAPADIPAYTEEDVISDGIADTAGGVAGGSANSGGASHDGSTAPDTDAEWAQQANELLGGLFEPGALSVALGRYLTHQSLTSDQANMVRATIGQLGYPPGGQYPLDTSTGATPSALTEPKSLRLWSSPKGTTGTDWVAIEWNAVPGATDYRIYRGSGDSIGASTDTKHYVQGLRPGTSYTFTVAAVAGGKEGPRSAPLTVKTKTVSLTKPATPTVSAITRTSVKLTTSKVTGADYYRWYITGADNAVSDGPTVTVTGLKPNTSYSVTVRADTSTGAVGPESGRRTFRTKR